MIFQVAGEALALGIRLPLRSATARSFASAR
jgi:hypothetical protein